MKMNTMMDLLVGESDKEPPILVELPDDIEGARENIPPSKPFSNLQAQLCPSEVYCCAPRTGTWYDITIANLEPVAWQKDAIESLVLEDKTKQTLCELVEEHKRGRLEGVLTDFIRNKGQVFHNQTRLITLKLTLWHQGLVLVLHGPPGVGKTLTAGKLVGPSSRHVHFSPFLWNRPEPNIV